ncbi:uncharacterized protein LOC130013202 [Patella vulgata]|uniref:uncharacterized protein LOC130013202 n=1 Tax=Patella vulgata TaxID=6465 RepID=UPI0024A9561F|nr:uncharacterized protein LOC130013202 [Patella vulgata]
MIPVDRQREWNNWLTDLANLHNLSIQRCVKPQNFGKIVNTQIHHFSDASQEGYGSVTYLRFQSDKNEIHISFLLGRSCVAPIKPHTIVKLELAAATSIVRIHNMLSRELSIPINQVYFWSDSQTVLKYIHDVKARHQVFVANRLAVIHDGSNVNQWRFVPGKLNPADLASRGSCVENIANNSMWLCGPEFLKLSINDWPENIVPLNNDEDIQVPTNFVRTNDSVNAVNTLIDKYSDFYRLKRAISWWLRLKQILKYKAQKCLIPDSLCTKSLSVEEINSAEVEIIKFVQNQVYSDEIKCLSEYGENPNNVKNVKNKSEISSLDPFLKDGILRVGGRLRNANVPFNFKHQIILPKSCHVSNLIAKYCHVNVAHMGRNHTISNIRKKYWIVKCGVLVKSILSKCVICRKYQSRVSEQKMSDIPYFRLKPDLPAFSIVGIDYFGPFEIKTGRSIRKRYGVVFTCMISCATHIEVSNSLDTSSCVNALRRFIARRGTPSDIYSDNGTNLIGAQKELKQSLYDLNQTQIENFSTQGGFKWHFNPPTASHFGGLWERQIRTIRKILYGILCEQFLRTAQSDEELITFLCEVEAVINSRPLTCVSSDSNDLEVITPNSLLMCHQNVLFPPGLFNERDVYSKRRWRQIQYLTDLFWKRWTDEYLHSLQRREKWLNPSRNIKVGDIALIVDSSAPRGSWPMGIVEEVYPDKHGLVRSVKLRTKTSILTRPIAKLCLILENDS